MIVFGTPVYWYGPTVKMKLLIDRMRPFIISGKLKGKEGCWYLHRQLCCEVRRRSFDCVCP